MQQIKCTEEIFKAVGDYYSGWNVDHGDLAMGADAVMPLLIYCLSKSTIRNPFSQFEYVFMLLPQSFVGGLEGHKITMLEAAASAIISIMKDPSMLEKNLEDAKQTKPVKIKGK